MESVPQGDKANCLPHKGHEFIPTLYHFPSNCEACSKPLWHVFKPPPALECRRCHVKCHKDHLDKKEDVIAPCKGEPEAENASMCLLLLLLLIFTFIRFDTFWNTVHPPFLWSFLWSVAFWIKTVGCSCLRALVTAHKIAVQLEACFPHIHD